MTIRSMGQFGTARLSLALVAILMIAAVACSSGSSNQTASTATSIPAANTDGGSGVITEAEATATSEAAFEDATGALFLEMNTSSTDDVFVTQNSYEVSGRTTVDALLSINDHVLDVDEQGRFAFSVDLEEGPNVIEVVASNATGQQFDEVLLVFYEPA